MCHLEANIQIQSEILTKKIITLFGSIDIFKSIEALYTNAEGKLNHGCKSFSFFFFLQKQMDPTDNHIYPPSSLSEKHKWNKVWQDKLYNFSFSYKSKLKIIITL